jgi:hypothetical protein
MAVKDRIAATLTKGEAIRAGVLDANQAAEVITSNSRKQYGFTRKMVPVGLPTEPKLYIYSVTEYGSHIVDGQSDGAGIVNLGPGFPMFEVFACPDGDDYSEQPCVIDPIHFFEEAKVDVTEHTFQSGQQMADAIMMIGPGMAASLNRTNIGWFISSSNPPKDAEIDRAKEMFTAQCQRLLREADSYHARNMLNEINETHRRAAKWLKQTKKPWVSVEFKMIDCPGCMEAVREGIIYHAPPQGCGYIFDIEEYNKRYHQAKSNPAKQQQPAQ